MAKKKPGGAGGGASKAPATVFEIRGSKRKPARKPDDRRPRDAGQGGPRGRGRTGLGINVEAWIASAAAGMTQK